MRNILTILQKEWLDLRQQRLLVAGIVAPALILAVLSLVALSLAGRHEGLPSGVNIPVVAVAVPGLDAGENFQIGLGGQISLLLLLLPVIVTGSVASYSIVGEKLGRTLEPLLATPVQSWELLIAKILTAVVPGVLATWTAGLLVGVCVPMLAKSPAVAAAILSSEHLVLFVLGAPLLALAAVSLTVSISARVSDVRTAQQTSGVLVLPVLLLLFGPAFGLAIQGVLLTLLIVGMLTIVSTGLLALAIVTFQRERILTRWR